MIVISVLAAAVAAAVMAWFVQRGVRTALLRYRQTFTRAARVQLSEFFLFIDPMQLWVANVILCLAVAGLAGLLTGSVIIVLACVGACVLLPRRWMRHLRRQRLRQFDSQLPDALLALASGIRAGAGLGSALREVVAEAPVPLAQEFGLLMREQRLGVPLDTALANLAARMPSEASSLVVSALRIASGTGGNLAEALERIAAMLRTRLHMESRVDALTAQGRMQAWVVGCLPALLALVLHRLEPEAMAKLWSTPVGWATVCAIVLMEATGLWLIRRIVRIDV
nr:type II secretion system F family protein [Pseudomonas sp.]